MDDVRVLAVIARTLESLSANGTQWSSGGMARASGLSASTVQRIWRAFGLQPHRSETFKLPTDPDFVAKVRDLVRLYMAPPERALVLNVPAGEWMISFGMVPPPWFIRSRCRSSAPAGCQMLWPPETSIR